MIYWLHLTTLDTLTVFKAFPPPLLSLSQHREQSWAFCKQNKEGFDRWNYASDAKEGMHMYGEGGQGEYKVIGGKWKGVACSYSLNSASKQVGVHIETCSSSKCVCVCVACIMIYIPLCNERTKYIHLPASIVQLSNSITNVPVQGTICHPFWPECPGVLPALTVPPLSGSPIQQSHSSSLWVNSYLCTNHPMSSYLRIQSKVHQMP